MQANATTHPLTACYQRVRPVCLWNGWLPDAVTDTTAKRRRKAKRLLGDGEGIFSRLWLVPDTLLYHLVVPLPRGLDFYLDAPALAHIELAQLLGTVPRYVRVALGRAQHRHIHVLVALHPYATLPSHGTYGSLHWELVQDADHLEQLADYFSRPNDERAGRPHPRDLARYTRSQLDRQRLDASELYLQARHHHTGRQLPRRSWSSHLPRLRPDPAARVRRKWAALMTCRSAALWPFHLRLRWQSQPICRAGTAAQGSVSPDQGTRWLWPPAHAPPLSGGGEVQRRLYCPAVRPATR